MKKTVCVDLDGVLADYRDGWKGVDHIGEPIEGARGFLERLCKIADVVIFTTRCCEEINRPERAHLLANRVREWLAKHDMPHHDVYVGQGKPIASAYVDDRAVVCEPQKAAGGPVIEFCYALDRVQSLIAHAPAPGEE